MKEWVSGCKECEADRLLRWAVDRHIIRSHTPPVQAIDQIIAYVTDLEERRGVAAPQEQEKPPPSRHRHHYVNGWFVCSCGWDPAQNGLTYNAPLKEAHAAVGHHLAEQDA